MKTDKNSATALMDDKKQQDIDAGRNTQEGSNQLVASDIEAGMFWTRRSHGVIVGPSSRAGMWMVKNDNGFQWEVGEEIILREMQFSDISKGQPISKTGRELIELVKTNPRTAMMVKFNKKVDEAVVAEMLQAGQGDMTDRQWKSLCKKAIAGEERIYRGFHTSHFDEHGRLGFIAHGEGFRLLDLRTVTNVILEGTAYFRR